MPCSTLGGEAIDEQREVEIASLRADFFESASSAASWSSKIIFES